MDTIEHGAEMDDEVISLFKHNPRSLRGYSSLAPTFLTIYYILGLSTKYTKLTDIQFANGKIIEKRMSSGFKTALKNGIRTALGTDAAMPYVTHYGTWKELKLHVRDGGTTNRQAIMHATKSNSEILGIDKEVGTLESGKYADFIVVDGDPIENLNYLGSPYMVVKNGQIVKKTDDYIIPEIENMIKKLDKEM